MLRHHAVIAVCLLIAHSLMDGPHSAHAAAPDTALFRDTRCPFSARFENGAKPTVMETANARSAEVTGRGYRVSLACIENRNSSETAPLQGTALSSRLNGLAQALGIRAATVTVPVSPGPNCGLIEGLAQTGGATIKTRTQFCYGPRAYFIAETTSDGSAGADTIVAAVLASIAAD